MILSRFILPLILLLCGFAVRAVYLDQFQGNPFYDYVPSAWDQTVYHRGAIAFSEGDLLAVAPGETNKFSPLYQYFLGILYRLFGVDLRMVWSVQGAMGVASSLLIYAIGRRYFKAGVAFTGALFFSLYAGNWLYEGTLYRETFMTFLELSALWLLLRMMDRPGWPTVLLSALSFSLFMQSRTNNVLVVVAVLAFLWGPFFSRPEKGKKWLAPWLIVFVIASLPLLGWVKAVHGKWGFYDQDGPETFLFANLPDYSGKEYKFTPLFHEVVKTVPLETGPVIKFVLRNIGEHPWDYFQLYLRKTFYYFNDYETPNTVNFYLSQEFSPILKWGIPFGALASLSLMGFFMLWRERGKWNLLHVFFATNFLMFLPFFVTSRFRLLIIPFMCLFAGYAAHFIYKVARDGIQQKKKGPVAGLMAVLLFLLWATHTRPLPEGKIRILDLINIGSFYMSNTRLEDDGSGLYYYWRAWELSRTLQPVDQRPELTRRAMWDYYRWQASDFEDKKDIESAIAAYRKALFFDYGKAEEHARLAQILFEDHKAREAFIEALRSADIDPGLSTPHILLAIVYNHTLNRPMKALYHMQRAWSLAEERDKPDFHQQIKSYLDRLVILGMIDPSVSLEDPEVLRDMAGIPTPTPTGFRLPSTIAKGSNKQAENYMISLFEHLILNPKANKGAIYRQLAEIHGTILHDVSAEYYYMERAHSAGLDYEGFERERESTHVRWATAQIPWGIQPLGRAGS
jgi:tetratricopeptide (TPR) repeat protein